MSKPDIIGLRVQLQRPFEQVCCRGVAIIGSSNGPHAAALTCAGCGRFRGWMPHNAYTAITEVVERFGRPDQPIDLKIPRFTPEEEASTMAKDAKSNDRNRGVLFKNDKKETERDPTATGSLDVDGVPYWISAWTNTSKKTGDKFWSLSIRRKDEPNDRPAKPAVKSDMDAAIPF
jgi:hypothetical protein